jgi:hypothetical protein
MSPLTCTPAPAAATAVRNATRLTCSLATVLTLSACTTAPEPAASPPAAPVSSVAGPASSAVPGSKGASHRVAGAVVRFAAGGYSVDVTIGADTPAVRDFLSMLPLRLRFEDLGGREKIGYLPREINTGGSPGSDPEDGDLIYFVPWGNLGFYYDAAGVDHSAETLHIGRYNATAEQLDHLENGPVTVTLVG